MNPIPSRSSSVISSVGVPVRSAFTMSWRAHCNGRPAQGPGLGGAAKGACSAIRLRTLVRASSRACRPHPLLRWEGQFRRAPLVGAGRFVAQTTNAVRCHSSSTERQHHCLGCPAGSRAVRGRHACHRRLDDAAARRQDPLDHCLTRGCQLRMPAAAILTGDALDQAGGFEPVEQLHRTRACQPDRGGQPIHRQARGEPQSCQHRRRRRPMLGNLGSAFVNPVCNRQRPRRNHVGQVGLLTAGLGTCHPIKICHLCIYGNAGLCPPPRDEGSGRGVGTHADDHQRAQCSVQASVPAVELWLHGVSRGCRALVGVCLPRVCYARRILGWRVASMMATAMMLDSIEQAIWTRQRDGHPGLE